jgi:hypothetical protein
LNSEEYKKNQIEGRVLGDISKNHVPVQQFVTKNTLIANVRFKGYFGMILKQ